jgi:hypothetical protein
MSHTHTSLSGRKLPSRRVIGTLFAAAAAIAGLLTVTVLSQGLPAAGAQGAAVAPAAAAAAVATPSPGTGVPAASTVFGGKDLPAEEPAPTF